MAHDDHRAAIVAQEIHQPRLRVAVQVVGRLVEEQQVRVGEKHARELDAPALATGQHAQGQVDAVEPEAEAACDLARVRLARVAAGGAISLLSLGVALDRGERVVVLELDVQLGELSRGAVEAAPGQDVRQSRRSRLASRPRVLRHVAESPAMQGDAGGCVVLAREHLEQARLTGAVAAHQADLVAFGHGEARVGENPARDHVDGEIADL